MRFVVFATFLLLAVAAPGSAGVRAEEADRVQIVADQEAGAVRFVIDGKEAAHLDAEGLHVRGDINFGGALTDFGETGYRARARARAGGAQAEVEHEE